MKQGRAIHVSAGVLGQLFGGGKEASAAAPAPSVFVEELSSQVAQEALSGFGDRIAAVKQRGEKSELEALVREMLQYIQRQAVAVVGQPEVVAADSDQLQRSILDTLFEQRWWDEDFDLSTLLWQLLVVAGRAILGQLWDEAWGELKTRSVRNQIDGYLGVMEQAGMAIADKETAAQAILSTLEPDAGNEAVEQAVAQYMREQGTQIRPIPSENLGVLDESRRAELNASTVRQLFGGRTGWPIGPARVVMLTEYALQALRDNLGERYTDDNLAELIATVEEALSTEIAKWADESVMPRDEFDVPLAYGGPGSKARIYSYVTAWVAQLADEIIANAPAPVPIDPEHQFLTIGGRRDVEMDVFDPDRPGGVLIVGPEDRVEAPVVEDIEEDWQWYERTIQGAISDAKGSLTAMRDVIDWDAVWDEIVERMSPQVLHEKVKMDPQGAILELRKVVFQIVMDRYGTELSQEEIGAMSGLSRQSGGGGRGVPVTTQ